MVRRRWARHFWAGVLLAGLAACASGPVDQSAAGSGVASDAGAQSWADALGAQIAAPFDAPQHRAFDFWIGEWEANWRGRPQGEFYHQKEGSWTRQRVFPVLSGKALIELAWARDNPDEASQRGFSIRYFDPARARWVMAQNWPSARGQGSAFTDQLIGEEHLGRLTMYSVTQRPGTDGELVTQHRRYNFTDVRPGISFRWDGSNTQDEGATWFTWNIVDFLRQRDLDPFGAAGTSFPGVHQKSLCTNEPHGGMNALEGQWRGTVANGDGATGAAHLAAGLVLDGCGVLAVLETAQGRTLMTFGYIERFEKWVMMRLDDRPDTLHAYFVADEPGAAFVEAPALSIRNEFDPYDTMPASYQAGDDASRRFVFEDMGDDALILREEVRGEDGWRAEARYQLSRKAR